MLNYFVLIIAWKIIKAVFFLLTIDAVFLSFIYEQWKPAMLLSLYRLRQKYIAYLKVDKKTKMTAIKTFISLLFKQRAAAFIHLLLKGTSNKWWPLFTIHCHKRFLKFFISLKCVHFEFCQVSFFEALNPWPWNFHSLGVSTWNSIFPK